MFKQWVRKRAIFSIIITIILCVVCGMLLIFPHAKVEGENLLKTSIYDNTDIDFVIPQPTKAQLVDIEKESFIEDSFGFYYTEATFNIMGKNIKEKMLISDDEESLEITMYNKKRLIKSTDKKYENPIYIDYAFAQQYNLNVDDKIIYSGIEMYVARIYETNVYYNSAVFAPLVGELSKKLSGKLKSYSAAYLSVNDISAADNYLKGYKPLGRLKDRDAFSSDEAYEMHYNAWASANFYNEITIWGNTNNIALEKSYFNLGLILIVIIEFIVSIVLFFIDGEKKYFSNLQNRKAIKYFYIIDAIVTIILGNIILCTGIAVSSGKLQVYVPHNVLVNMYLYSSLSIIGVAILSLIGNLVCVYLTNRSRRSLKIARINKEIDKEESNSIISNSNNIMLEVQTTSEEEIDNGNTSNEEVEATTETGLGEEVSKKTEAAMEVESNNETETIVEVEANDAVEATMKVESNDETETTVEIDDTKGTEIKIDAETTSNKD